MKTTLTFGFSKLTGYGWLGVLYILLSWVTSRADAQSFTAVASQLPGVYRSAVAWGDYDNDGRLDLILTGYTGSSRISQLYRNTVSGFVDVTTSQFAALPGVEDGSVAWGDYDNDGRLDLIITGNDGSSRVSKLYHNTLGGFVDVTLSQLPEVPGVSDGSVAWGDYDNDGRLDLIITGQTSSAYISQLYHNTGSGFVDVTASQFAVLPGVTFSSVAWGDYDNDGRLDLILTGNTGSSRTSQLYRNTGSGFVDVTASQFAVLLGVTFSSVAWGDYDNDGRLDLILTGYTGSSRISQLYRNTVSGFVDVTTSQFAALPGVNSGSVAWGDYDNDGRLDLILTGSSNVSKLYHNTGSAFEDVTTSQFAALPGLYLSSVAWGDYDNDGRLDLFLTGSTNRDYVSQLYRNLSPKTNQAPAPPTGLSSTPGSNGRSVSLSWQPPTDDHTPPAGLSYNLYVSDSPQGQTVLSAMADKDKKGFRRVVRLGNSQPTSFTLTGLTPGQTYYWSVQALDGAFAGSEFALQQRFTTSAFVDVSSQLPGLAQLQASSVVCSWGDYDNDGRLDLLLTGLRGGDVSRLYHNTPGGFVDVTASQLPNLPGVARSSVAWGDYDNDGRLDLILTGSAGSSFVSRLYHNTAGGFVDVTASQFAALPGVYSSSVAWGDYDNDGRLDLILTGSAGSSFVSRLYHNTPGGFVDVTASQLPNLPGLILGSVAWGDYDNDGRLDLLLTGQIMGGENISQLYHNTGSGFENKSTLLPNLPEVYGGAVAWGDYDNDGRLDLILTGARGTVDVSRFYHNTPGGFVDVTDSQLPNLPGVFVGSVAWGDYDNDGRLDLMFTGYASSPVSQLYHNTPGGFVDVTVSQLPNLPGLRNSSVAWGDYDNDGRLDLFITGFTGSSFVSQLYRNLSPKTNRVPDAPTNLSSSPGPDGTSVQLSWQPPAKEDETPSAALSYNLYVSDSPQGQTVLSAMADQKTGFRRVVRLGNSQPTSFTLTGLSPGQTYYWSVQTLDAAFAGSDFARPQRFTSCQPLAITGGPASGSAVCAGALVTATVSVSGTGPVTYQWYKDGVPITNNSSATTATLSLPLVSTASAGSYMVALSSSCGSLTSTAFSLTVNAPPTPSLLSSGPLTCAQTSVTLTAGGGTAYTFSGPAGPLASSGNTVVVSQPGSYSVSVSSASGCVSTTQISVEQDLTLAAPSLTASATATTTNQPISITASGCQGQLSWSLLGGSGQDQGSFFTLSQPGSYTLSARCSLNGCQSPLSPPLSLRIESPAGFQLLAPSYDCATGAITFNIAGGDGSLVEYFATGITPWSPNPHQQVEDDLRTDPKKITLMARQHGLVVSYRFDLPAYCAGLPTPPQSSTNPEPVRGPSIPTQTAYQGQPYRFAVPAGTFVDPQGEPLLYYVLGLPAGLSFSGMSISGTPSAVGKSTVTVIGVDPVGQTANTSFELVVEPPVADLTVLVYVQPSVVYGSSSVGLRVEVVELNGLVGSRGSITVRIPKVSGLSLGLAAGQAGVWQFTASNVNYYELSTSQVIRPGESLRAELTGALSGGATSGQLSVSATVVGGGEVRLTNNTDAEKLEYFQQ